jgi:hypothetical protein
VSYTSALTNYIYIPYTLGAALTRASTCSGHRSRSLGPLSTDGLCIRGQPPPSQGEHRVQFEVHPHFVSRLLYNSPLRLRVRSPSATTSHRYDGTAIHTPALATRFSFISPLSFSQDDVPISGPSLATADANKNLDDVMCISCPMGR